MTDAAPIIYGTPTCTDCRRSKALLDAEGVAYTWVDISASAADAAKALAISGRTSTPLIVYSDGTHQVEPTDDELTEKLVALGLK